MKTTICDQCHKECRGGKEAVYLHGYYPKNASGILLPEAFRQFNFCHRDCFLAWMTWAMEKENFNPRATMSPPAP